MSTAFDALKLADRLEAAGFSAEQARGTALALSEALNGDLASTSDLKTEITELRTGLKAEIADIRADVLILKWMCGFTLALMVTSFVKTFVH